MSFLFFLSGFSSLVYQVLWARRLSLFFGSDVYAVSICLSVFMGGLSLGSVIVNKKMDQFRNPLRIYGLIEMTVGIYALLFNPFLHLFTPMLKAAYQNTFESAPIVYQSIRVLTASITLLFPTTLMGMTFPLMMKSFVRNESEIGRRAGSFYAVNTFGALLGVLVSAFILMPAYGSDMTNWIAVAMNVLIGTAALSVSVDAEMQKTESLSNRKNRAAGTAPKITPLILGIGISGMAALALEVVWTRFLTLSFSSTVYAFAVMLATFLFGIFWGSGQISKRIDLRTRLIRDFGLLECWLGAGVALLGLSAFFIPSLLGKFIRIFFPLFHGNFGIAATAAEVLVSSAFIFVPTLLLGAAFPIAVKAVASDPGDAGPASARIYASNTAGAILGALLAGFILIPNLGCRMSFLVIAVTFLLNGFWLLSLEGFKRSAIFPSGFSLLAAAGVLLLPPQTIMNYNIQLFHARPAVLYHGEGVSHTIDLVRANKTVTMLVDGNIEADTSAVQRKHFILKAHLPLLLHPAPRDVAVVGLGLGITLAATERNPSVQSINVIEISPEMVEAHKYYNEEILKNPKVSLTLDDARNYFAMSDRTFDMITADPIHPRITGVGYLYTREYYELIKNRLKPGGVVCQWMPMYNISKNSFDAALRTFAAVFPNSSFWYVRGHGLLIGTLSPFKIDYQNLKRRIAEKPVAVDLASIGIYNVNDFLSYLLLGPEQVDRYLHDTPNRIQNTDDNAYLEYRTPFEFLQNTKSIVRGLLPNAGYDPDIILGASKNDREALYRAWHERKLNLMPELDEPLQ